MANSTLISVPANFENPEELRYFLIRLVSKLDEVIGNRADDPAALSVDVNEAIVQLNNKINSQNLTLQAYANARAAEAQSNAVNAAETYTNNAIDDLEQAAIPSLTFSALVASITYDQTEIQKLADDLITAKNTVNDILAKLRSAGILEV